MVVALATRMTLVVKYIGGGVLAEDEIATIGNICAVKRDARILSGESLERKS